MNSSKEKFEVDFISVWFLLIFIATLTYCICNWEKVTILNPFTGNSAIFCLLITWTFLPFIKKLKFRGIEGEFNNPLEQNKLQAEANLIETAQNTPNINVDVNIQNDYNNEIKDIINAKEAKNV